MIHEGEKMTKETVICPIELRLDIFAPGSAASNWVLPVHFRCMIGPLQITCKSFTVLKFSLLWLCIHYGVCSPSMYLETPGSCSYTDQPSKSLLFPLHKVYGTKCNTASCSHPLSQIDSSVISCCVLHQNQHSKVQQGHHSKPNMVQGASRNSWCS